MEKCKCCSSIEIYVSDLCIDCCVEFLDIYKNTTYDEFINKKLIQQRSKKIKNILNE
jgi:hypothetical protein